MYIENLIVVRYGIFRRTVFCFCAPFKLNVLFRAIHQLHVIFGDAPIVFVSLQRRANSFSSAAAASIHFLAAAALAGSWQSRDMFAKRELGLKVTVYTVVQRGLIMS